ncbi:hypothetical protein BHM03_00003531 [Ensete ventricosum]|nr:hypothetical protein BHM03_00003531 [Ensete ventricosum]
MDLNVLRKKPRMPSGKSAPAAGAESSQSEMEVIHVETMAKRLIGSSAPDQVTASRLGKRAKVAGHHYQMALLDRVRDVGHLVIHMGNWASLLEAEIEKLKTEGDLEQLVVAWQQVDEL